MKTRRNCAKKKHVRESVSFQLALRAAWYSYSRRRPDAAKHRIVDALGTALDREMDRTTSYRVVRSGAGEETIWKNGQGRSWSLGRSEPSAGQDHDWSVTIAVLQDEREFSSYPGIHRTLSVIEGAGMQLRLEGREVLLKQTTQPFAFEGETRIVGDVVAQKPVMDFNVLTRRSVCNHSSVRLEVSGESAIACEADVLVVYVQATLEHIRIAELDLQLGQGDTLFIECNVPRSVCFQGEGAVLVSQIKFN